MQSKGCSGGGTGQPGGLSSGPVYFINRGWQISIEALLPWPFGEDVLSFRLLTNYCVCSWRHEGTGIISGLHS